MGLDSKQSQTTNHSGMKFGAKNQCSAAQNTLSKHKKVREKWGQEELQCESHQHLSSQSPSAPATTRTITVRYLSHELSFFFSCIYIAALRP
jgi:hypothetical protein